MKYLLGAMMLLTAGCTVEVDGSSVREAGPLANDLGKVTYWRVSGSETTVESCTDNPSFEQTAPTFGDNSFLMYKVTSDTEALFQSCDTTSASSCSDDPDGDTWSISGHTLTYSGDTAEIEGDDVCGFVMTPLWTLVDNGDTADWTIAMEFQADPTKSDCDAFDAEIAAAAENGSGLIGCTITLDIGLDFEKTEAP